MFDSLSNRLGEVFDRLKRRGALSETDVGEALREIRIALLEADVALPVVKDFIAAVRERAVGSEVLKSITPGQMVVKIVHDHLIEMLGAENAEIALNVAPPAVILMVGLQGSGKTTSSGKLALRLKERQKKKVLLASLDVARPAAQEQLAVLAQQIGVTSLEIVKGETPLAIAQRALIAARTGGHDVVILDTAGRLAIDQALMDEVKVIRDATKPAEILLVVDAMTGQDAVNTGRAFQDQIGITGIVLTRIDGDARGGAALAMRAVTGQPIKLIGTGEKLDALEEFHPERIASRILGMGDVVSLVERAAETIDRDEAEALARKLEKGGFDLDDFAKQLQQMRKMGGMSGVMGLLPGIGKVKKQLAEANIDDKMLKRQEAIISSMTLVERRNFKLLNARRKQRIAAGSGTEIAEINRLLKQFQDLSRMMKQVRAMSKGGGLQRLLPGLAKGMGMSGLPPGLAQGLSKQLPPGLLPPGRK